MYAWTGSKTNLYLYLVKYTLWKYVCMDGFKNKFVFIPSKIHTLEICMHGRVQKQICIYT